MLFAWPFPGPYWQVVWKYDTVAKKLQGRGDGAHLFVPQS